MLNKFIILFMLISLGTVAHADEVQADEAQADEVQADEAQADEAQADEVQADEVQISPENPGSYTVVKGDTLWDIAGRFLVEPWRWPEIWNVNPQIADPHLIYPGDIISLSYEDGVPVLNVNRPGANSRKVKLSPAVRSYADADAIPSIPIDVIRNFLSHPQVVFEGEMDSWPYVVSSYGQNIISGPGDRIYVKGLRGAKERQKYSIYRQGLPYLSHGNLLGYESIYVGEAILDKQAEVSSLLVTATKREVIEGDRLVLQSQEDIMTDILPHEPSAKINASVISATDVLSEIGLYQVVVIDAGNNDGVDIGTVLGVYQSGDVVEDEISSRNRDPDAFNNSELVDWLGKPKSRGDLITLPTEYAGVVLVFRTFDQVSYGLVMEAITAIHLNDAVTNL